MKKIIIISAILFVLNITPGLHASNEVVYIMNLPTCQTTGEHIILLDIAHRYLDVNSHATNISISLGYGIFDWLDAYAGYSFKYKDISASGKANVFNDFSDDDWFSLALIAGGGYKDTNGVNNAISASFADKDSTESRTTLDSKERASYYGQFVIQKHFHDNRLSLGIVPMYAYNTNFYGIESSDDYSAGTGISTEIYFFDRVALCGEAVFNLAGFAFKYANYNIGVKYAGYRHNFNLWVGNSPGYSPVEYMIGSPDTALKLNFSFTREFDL